MRRVATGICAAAALALAAASLPAHAQTNFLQQSSARKESVEYLYPGQVTVTAGKPKEIDLHFRVVPGLHINSHTPATEEMIPTTLSIPAGSGVRLESAVYPPGSQYALPIDPNVKLSVYTGEFTIRARIVAAAGSHQVKGKLRYQACDNSQCLPPRTAPVVIDVTGK